MMITDGITAAVYGALCVLALALMALCAVRDRKNRLFGSTMFLFGMYFLWSLCSVLVYATDDVNFTRFMYDAKLPFVALTVVAMFIVTLKFYRMRSYTTPVVLALLFIIPACLAVLSFTSVHHNFVRQELVIHLVEPLRTSTNVRGVWFWIHTVYGYLLMMSTVFVAFYQHRKLPGYYRRPSWLLIAGCIISLAGNVVVVVAPALLPFDITLLSVGAGLVLVYFAAISNRSLDALVQARSELFNFMDAAVMILEDARYIVESNDVARLMLQRMELGADEKDYHRVLERARAMAAKWEPNETEQGSADYTFEFPTGTEVFNIREKPLYSRGGEQIASLAISEDVTRNRQLIASLEINAGMDALTGLRNRYFMKEKMEEYDQEAYLPLCVISCDLNGLKQVNDTLGHQQGDVLLRVAAETLEAACPSNGFVARIGGDEFMLLLYNTLSGQPAEVMDAVKEILQQMDKYPFQPSIAMGYAIKTHMDTPLDEVVDWADRAMYAQKYKQYTHAQR